MFRTSVITELTIFYKQSVSILELKGSQTNNIHI